MVDGSIYFLLNGAKGLGHDVFLLAFLIALFQCRFTTMTYGQTQVQTNLYHLRLISDWGMMRVQQMTLLNMSVC